MAVLLVVHHSPSPTLAELLEAALAGARDLDITGVDVRVRPALTCSPVEALQADGLLLGTPANIGYMSGASNTSSIRISDRHCSRSCRHWTR